MNTQPKANQQKRNEEFRKVPAQGTEVPIWGQDIEDSIEEEKFAAQEQALKQKTQDHEMDVDAQDEDINDAPDDFEEEFDDDSDEDLSDDEELKSEDNDDDEPDEEDENYSGQKGRYGKQTAQKTKVIQKTSTQRKKYTKQSDNFIKRTMRAAKKAAKDDKLRFICVKCNEEFSSGWALGGHASRVHPGESDSYRKKIKRREERVFERMLLAKAKERHAEFYGEEAPLNRVKIRKFKKEIKKEIASK